jgi:tetratricopeptide (TPR) repeat protein
VFNNWGDALLALGRYKEAVIRYKKATELNPSAPSAYRRWGMALLDLGQMKEAEKKFKIADQMDD